MQNHLECEVKALLEEREFNHLIEVYKDKGSFREQENIYFGDKKGLIKSLKYGMRIRTKINGSKMTIKIPTIKGFLEINQIISEEEKEAIIQRLELPIGNILTTLHKVGLTNKDLLIIGELHTTRLVVIDAEYEICLDKNTYNNKIDYEIEVEGPSVDKARLYLKQLLNKEKIPFKENFLSKYVRATN